MVAIFFFDTVGSWAPAIILVMYALPDGMRFARCSSSSFFVVGVLYCHQTVWETSARGAFVSPPRYQGSGTHIAEPTESEEHGV